jgi:hypothetical protein
MGMSDQRHAPDALYPQGKDPPPPVPIGQEAGWAPELVWTQGLEEKYSAPCWGSNPDRPAHGLTLYCLSYCGSSTISILGNFNKK